MDITVSALRGDPIEVVVMMWASEAEWGQGLLGLIYLGAKLF